MILFIFLNEKNIDNINTAVLKTSWNKLVRHRKSLKGVHVLIFIHGVDVLELILLTYPFLTLEI
jgi:hypothetical protein